MKPDRPPGLWEKATEVHEKFRSAIFNVLHLPVIDANISISGTCRWLSSARTATEVIEKDVNATAVTRQHMRMKRTPRTKMQLKLCSVED